MEIKLFGIAKDIVGKKVLKLDHSPANVELLKKYLIDEYPEFSNLNSLAIAVNHYYAEEEKTLSKYDEIAVIPPVSGG